MKRFHVHIDVEDLDRSLRFYTGLFGAEPAVRKDDYAKWMLDDPRINFAISRRGRAPGVNHLGVEAESADELAALRARFEAADGAATAAEPGANCCYAKSDKHWVTDPQGIAWEAFHTRGMIAFFDRDGAQPARASACCTPAVEEADVANACCVPATASSGAACCSPASGTQGVARHG